MTDKNVWFVTGASRGMGVDIVKSALAAGHAVVATGRNTDAVAKAVGEADDLLVVKLDVTRPQDAKAAVAAAADRFGRIDVLVNNAGNFYAGFFRTELLTDDSTKWPEPSIDDYAEKTRQTIAAWKKMNGLQGGDSAKLAKALVQLASEPDPPLRWPAGADAIETFEKKARELL